MLQGDGRSGGGPLCHALRVHKGVARVRGVSSRARRGGANGHAPCYDLTTHREDTTSGCDHSHVRFVTNANVEELGETRSDDGRGQHGTTRGSSGGVTRGTRGTCVGHHMSDHLFVYASDGSVPTMLNGARGRGRDANCRRR